MGMLGVVHAGLKFEYFLMYLTEWPLNASAVLSLHFEIDTGWPVLPGHGS